MFGEELFIDAIKQTFDQEDLAIIKLTELNYQFMKEYLSLDFAEFMRKYSFRQELDFNSNYFHTPNSFRTENLAIHNQELYKKGYFIIGSGLNGDPIVFNKHTSRIGYIFHDLLWESNSLPISEVHIDMGMDLGTFFYLSATAADFSIDAYTAKTFSHYNEATDF
ncbi:hypothetical protein NWE55_15095 [Myroides albus]|uniref:Uncharacterized protein n=1 Tax=Myroides albus TaxID=2562892 RepID=A0A6I3LLJ2_9FLAO|nr:hypothetical protein [Myroides albus]MTG97401.1 hypothetical protein [Myroides albus]UVD79430.1 hypothetical protein NWE55_15095 [Myroides albus]